MAIMALHVWVPAFFASFVISPMCWQLSCLFCFERKSGEEVSGGEDVLGG